MLALALMTAGGTRRLGLTWLASGVARAAFLWFGTQLVTTTGEAERSVAGLVVLTGSLFCVDQWLSGLEVRQVQRVVFRVEALLARAIVYGEAPGAQSSAGRDHLVAALDGGRVQETARAVLVVTGRWCRVLCLVVLVLVATPLSALLLAGWIAISFIPWISPRDEPTSARETPAIDRPALALDAAGNRDLRVYRVAERGPAWWTPATGRSSGRSRQLTPATVLVGSVLLIIALVAQRAGAPGLTGVAAVFFVSQAWLTVVVLVTRDAAVITIEAATDTAGVVRQALADNAEAPGPGEASPHDPHSRGAGIGEPGGASVLVTAVSVDFGAVRALEHVDLRVAADELVAVVGENGAGKTTLAHVLSGVLPPSEGTCLVTAGSTFAAPSTECADLVSYVGQETRIYPGSLLDNVLLGLPLDRAVLDELVELVRGETLLGGPGGWDRELGRARHAGEMSGGERQKVGIMRGFYACRVGGRRILLLDEPLAEQDVEMEGAFYSRLRSATQGLTTVMISHRLAGVHHADRAVVLEKGRVAEEGVHHELLSREGRYARLYRAQVAGAGRAT